MDPDTGDVITQTSASDGAGNGVDLPTILWIASAFFLGVPLLTMGVRLGRFTSGVGLGLALAASLWASVINAVGDAEVSDLIILAITASLFLVGFIVGAITIEYRIGTAALGAAGGMSIMLRIILMKEDLLVPFYLVDWILCGLFGALGLCLVLCQERLGVVIGSSATGSFLVCLGVDLLINKQSGMSLILRFLFDRNKHHLAEILGESHAPLLSTQIVMAVSIGLIPIFAFIQHKLFPQPFHRPRHRAASLLGDDVSIRSQTWFGRFRGKRHPPPLALNKSDESTTTLQAPQTPSAYGEKVKEATVVTADVPMRKLTKHYF